MRKLSLVSINKKIPIVIINMIRNIDGQEVENMKSAIDIFTHVKIKLTKTSSKFKGQITWLNNTNYFSYQIHKFGLTNNTEDI